jgi:ABC-type oligopeptide transport system substrate-binding subunit
MKLARLFLAVVAASTLAACTTDSPTAPSAPPSLDEAENTECGTLDPQVQSDGSILWVCSPGQTGSGG